MLRPTRPPQIHFKHGRGFFDHESQLRFVASNVLPENLPRCVAFLAPVLGPPLGYPGRVAEEGEDPVDRGAEVVDERMANGSQPIWLLELAHPISGNRRGLTVQPQMISRLPVVGVPWIVPCTCSALAGYHG